MTGTLRVELPWPSRVLSPNARGHYMAKARATRAARQQAFYTVRGMRPRSITAFIAGSDRMKVLLTFLPPDNRRRDIDGMLSSCKAYLDGIADALGVDDHKFTIQIERGEPTRNGLVIAELRPDHQQTNGV